MSHEIHAPARSAITEDVFAEDELDRARPLSNAGQPDDRGSGSNATGSVAESAPQSAQAAQAKAKAKSAPRVAKTPRWLLSDFQIHGPDYKSKWPRTFPALPIREGAMSAFPELTKKQAKTQAWREGMKEKKKEKRNEQTEQVIKEMKAAISASDLDSVD